jgi:hypothetical protein
MALHLFDDDGFNVDPVVETTTAWLLAGSGWCAIHCGVVSGAPHGR